jgi:hypothetical protein
VTPLAAVTAERDGEAFRLVSVNGETIARGLDDEFGHVAPGERGERDDVIRICATFTGERMRVTVHEAAALVMALLADDEVHAMWLHGRKP